MEPLKNAYTKDFFKDWCLEWSLLDSQFSEKQFLAQVFDEQWPDLELKQRIAHIAQCIQLNCSNDFKSTIDLLIKILKQLKMNGIMVGSYTYLFVPNFIELYGLGNSKQALHAIKAVTEYVSCEFTIRPLLLKHPELVLNQMLIWSKDKNPNVRRLSSEGCRPMLPWGKAIPFLKMNPRPILPILENLKTDESLFVRKSVANNLNDISKTHPDLFMDLIQSWKGKNQHTDWIIKHASRTLLKKGTPRIMHLFEYADPMLLFLENFKLDQNEVAFGTSLGFSFQLENKSKLHQLVRLEYGMYFLKANGQQNRKVFKLSEKKMGPFETIQIQKKHPIKAISTRRYYMGPQKIALIVNGVEKECIKFVLK